jgi:hypothetical protein
MTQTDWLDLFLIALGGFGITMIFFFLGGVL